MKTILVFLTVLGLSFAAPQFSPRSVSDDLQEIIALIPVEEIRAVAREHLANDGALAAVVVYLQGDDWRSLVDAIASKTAVQNFLQYLTDAGLNIQDLIASIREIIANAEPGVAPDENGSLRSLLDEVRALIPSEELIALLNDKLANSADFQALYAKVSSADAYNLVQEIRQIAEVQRLAQRLRDFDVRIDEALARVYGFLGWPVSRARISSMNLSDDIQEILALIPVDEIRAVARDHLATDGALAAAVVYLQGDEWRNLVDGIAAKAAVQSFLQYLTDAGLNIQGLIASIREIIANAEPGVAPDENGSLRALLDEVRALIPSDELIALLNDKLENSADFQALYAKVSSADARSLVEEIRQIDEVQRLAQRLRDFGVRIDEALARIFAFLGWTAAMKF